MKKIKKLTLEQLGFLQRNQIDQSQEFMKPGHPDPERIREWVHWFYRLGDMKEPKRIEVVDNPYLIRHLKITPVEYPLQKKMVGPAKKAREQQTILSKIEPWARFLTQTQREIGAAYKATTHPRYVYPTPPHPGTREKEAKPTIDLWVHAWYVATRFWEKLGIKYPNQKDIERFGELWGLGIVKVWVTKQTCYLLRKPLSIQTRIDENNFHVLHSETRPALNWADGTWINYLHGEPFMPGHWYGIVTKKISYQKLLQIDPIPKRVAALRVLGPKYVLRNARTRLIDENSRKDKLYRVTIGGDPMFANIIEYTCPSTAKRYVKWAHEETTTFEEAIKLRFGLTETNQKIIGT